LNIRAENLYFGYNNGALKQSALRDVCFTLQSGECVALVGASGSGKSTLAQLLVGFNQPEKGKLFLDGQPFNWSKPELKSLRRRIGLVFQFPEQQIFEATVFDEVAFAARRWGLSEDHLPDLVGKALQTVGLDPDAFIKRNPMRLSGGEARLVSIASMLVVEPDWLILDEPTLGLDWTHRNCILQLIRQRRKAGKGVLVITHDLTLVLEACPRVLALDGGELRFDGSSVELIFDDSLLPSIGLIAPEITWIWKKLKTVDLSGELNESTVTPTVDYLVQWVAKHSSDQFADLSKIINEFAPQGMVIHHD
jgi:energy-coupling factor transport system ATP-binding protein